MRSAEPVYLPVQNHQVFPYDYAGNSACILINCQENPDDATT